MIRTRRFLFLLFLPFVRAVFTEGSVTRVSCDLSQNCILPCRFRNQVINIKWIHEISKSLIVSYDHRGSSYSESFRSRVSLFEDQISRGNGDLLLRGVKVDDEGRYQCTAKINDTNYFNYVDLTVEAPVSDIRIHQDGNRITCSSEGIYPQPELTWSTEPPSNTVLQNRTTVHQTEEKLYNISSSLTVPDGSDRTYSCTIRTRKNQRTETSTRADIETSVSCLLNQDCILPCRFRNQVTNMKWEHRNSDSLIVSYDHRGSSYSESFRSRVSLFEDQISRGNGDLLLRGVKVDDEGEYWCFAKTNDIDYKYFVFLTVEAPVSDIRIHQDGNRITCSSEGIYPQPELTWSTEPPSNTTLNESTRIQETEDKLYNISSSLTVPDGSDWTYSCTIRTRRNQRRATLNIPVSVDFSGAEVTICCTSLNISKSSLVWRFNQRQIILTKTDRNISSISEDWRKHVRKVSASGSLTLQDVTSDQEGVYSCELSDDEETIITHLYLRRTGENLVVPELIRWTVVCVVIAAAAAGFIMFYKKKLEESEALQL
ncbi:CD276 antigen-like isoform X2 [Gambusia affinis]|uniref:CD276 antigen-like isoform X2 n=1 Tax=Gambusia affinis TaxID=33528 RepID=UPI001CDC0399|nr:CD276 antigen-like isoform X2 [Gambusia affinis]